MRAVCQTQRRAIPAVRSQHHDDLDTSTIGQNIVHATVDQTGTSVDETGGGNAEHTGEVGQIACCRIVSKDRCHRGRLTVGGRFCTRRYHMTGLGANRKRVHVRPPRTRTPL